MKAKHKKARQNDATLSANSKRLGRPPGSRTKSKHVDVPILLSRTTLDGLEALAQYSDTSPSAVANVLLGLHLYQRR